MAWTSKDIPSQAGKLAVVTGPTGLGYETGLELARAGADVILAGRSAGPANESLNRIRAAVPGAKVRFERLDLADLASVKAFASKLKAEGRKLDILVNNAGVMMPPKRLTTKDGFELQIGTNYLGHFALTAHLLPLLRGARVVSVSSISANPGRIRFDDLNWEREYKSEPAYSQSKLAMILFGYELQRQSTAHDWGITSLVAHPGVAATDLITKGPGPTSLYGLATALLPFVRQPASRGALPQLYAATSPDANGGAYYGPNGFQQIRGYPIRIDGPSQSRDTAVAKQLWELSEKLTGVQFAQAVPAH